MSLVLAATILSCASAVSMAATCTWTGAASPLWSNAANWSCPGGPVDGDSLVFPDVAGNKAMNDNFLQLSVGSLTFSGPGGNYSLTGLGNLTISGATAIVNRATGTNRNTINLTNPIKLGAPTATIDNATTNKGQLNLEGPIDLNGSTLNVVWDASIPTVTINGAISGAGGILVSGLNDIGLTLNGNNSFTGLVTVEGGYLQVGHPNALGAGGSAANGTIVKSGATLRIGADIANEWLTAEAGVGSNGNGNIQANGDKTWGGPVTLLAGGGQTTVLFNLRGQQLTFAGPVSGTAGVRCCNSTDGRLALANAGNTYSGPSMTNFNAAGVLRLLTNNALSPNSAITLNGSIGNVLDMGAFSGTAAAFTGSSNATLKITAGSKLTVNGPVSLANTSLELAVAGNPAIGAVFTIIDKTTAGAVSGTFNGVPEGGTVIAGGFQFTATYVGGNGNDVTLTVVGPVQASTLSVVKLGSGSGTVSGVGNGNLVACGGACSAQFVSGTTVTLTAQADAGRTFTGWQGPCTGIGSCQFPITANTTVTATFTTLTLGKILDIDGNNAYDALTDGLLALRYLFGLAPASLTTNALGSMATRTAPQAVINYLLDIRPLLDVDGNGNADALTDGLMIVRYLIGLRGDAVIANAVGSGATRATSAAIEAYIATLLP